MRNPAAFFASFCCTQHSLAASNISVLTQHGQNSDSKKSAIAETNHDGSDLVGE